MKKIKNYLQDYKDFLKPPKEGDIIKGVVIAKEKEGVFLDLLNYKTGVIKKDDLKFSGESVSKIKPGDEFVVKIIGPEDKKGFIPVSLKAATEDIIWDELKKLHDKKESVRLKVMSANKGGLMFNFQGIAGFMPVSQLSKEKYPKLENPTPDKIFQELKKFVGEEMDVQVLTVDKTKKKLIFKEAE